MHAPGEYFSFKHATPLSRKRWCALAAQAPARRRPLRRAWLGAQLPGGCGNGTGALARASRWLENSAEQEVDVPLERVYPMWEDRTRIPQWMPWISSVQVRALRTVPRTMHTVFARRVQRGFRLFMLWRHSV